MEDLSHLLKPDPVTAMAPTSQAGGHVPRSNDYAMTAPGSMPAADQYTFDVVKVAAEPVKVSVTPGRVNRHVEGDGNG